MDQIEVSHSHEEGINLSYSPKLRLVLIGVTEAGKSAVGNAILGKKAFDEVGVKTRASFSCQGLVRGQQVLVVDTPGWEWFNINGSSASVWTVKKEIMRSMSFCQPGAHALLLVVPLSFTFSQRECHAVEEHVELFGPEAWSCSLVLFTVLDRKQLRGTTLKQEVKLNVELNRLVEKCGGRFHALYSNLKEGENQVDELLAKITKMMANNGSTMLSSETVLEKASEMEKEEERRLEEEQKKREEHIEKVREALKAKELRRSRRRKDQQILGDEEQKASARYNNNNDLPSSGRSNFLQSCKQQ
ncbi:GTPase IMAP family member 4 [Pimephales promelas]|uniref:GTPase IMAP family member 4 n=1 Tax=Pimephales promelas TaxID=90988 RepID=UPI001955C555|nr:GTPase IMAP family member 4 [Pimephales promelas]XP_039541708.1 GTPase IMAP family member 4 [Pimephales promelas]KAG1967837.1 GTPase IMAP family [Pimephales promelas]